MDVCNIQLHICLYLKNFLIQEVLVQKHINKLRNLYSLEKIYFCISYIVFVGVRCYNWLGFDSNTIGRMYCWRNYWRLFGEQGNDQLYQEQKSQKVMQKLLQNQLQDGHWECNMINLDILVINFKILNDYIPKVLSEDSERQTKWINLVIFTILSLFFNLNDIVKVWQECLDCLLKIYIN
ncbi:unnamed protein product [Paramecium primaurelia]|uniref:Uncharacterized protein n=1 Tax=Paramecium primaurelia TaxID=5886 RepID=A0A8S1K775_PARPR|nr:unnamed protein product [Paramecium primaurelia]